jgi:hypothetical protein
MASSRMLRLAALVRTEVSEELSSSFIRVTRIIIPSSLILATAVKEALVGSYKSHTA